MKITPQPQERANVSIELTPYEQDVIQKIMGNVLGDTKGARGVANDLFSALKAAGADHSKFNVTGTVNFNP